MSFIQKAKILLDKVQEPYHDEVTDFLIELGQKDEFIQTIVSFMNIIKQKKAHSLVISLTECINRAYNPGLKSHIIDDFVRHRLELEKEINELKAIHKIYILEQKLSMYVNAEAALKGPNTALATYLILQIASFRGS